MTETFDIAGYCRISVDEELIGTMCPLKTKRPSSGIL